jgi:amino acid adenylation domain-containing protein
MAVLKAGGAYLPLDPASPGQRLRFIAEDAQIAVVLTRKSHVDCFESHTTRVITLDSDGWSSTDWCPDNPTNRACSTNLAYVIYTSGSTGIPKGVEIEHKSLVNLVRWHQRTYRVTTADRATQIAGLTFDATVWELWPYLTAGACVYLIDDETRLSPDHILVWLADRGITICFLPTPLAETVLSVPRPPNLELRCLLTGGDRLHDWAPADLPFELVNHYGPTENTVVSTRAVLGVMIDGRSPPIGRPIDNVQAYVLDSHGNPSPVGVPGELHVGGVGVARGYRNHPELTAEKFVPNPFQDRCGPRLYRTGDSVRWLADGTLEFLGRLDHQVKIRGFRIELGEIEAVLAQEPQVQQSVVLLREDRPGDQRLVAYVVPRDAETKPVDAYLRQRVQAKLPDYMVPSAFVVLQALPLTPNGKVNRSVLPAPEVDRADLAMAWDAPRTPTEESLAAIWSEVLGVGRVGIHDNFFELGGHSLLAVQLFARIEARLGRRLPLHALFKGATIADLAALLTAPVHESDDSAIVAIRPEGTKPPLFVVHSSTGSLLFWRRFLPHFSKDQPVYGLRPRNPNSSAQSQRDSHGQAVSIESLAADYVEQLAASFPNDAFRFAGYSFGGPLAYEMARQMRAMGRRVAFVGIVDTPASRRPRTWTQRLKLFPTFTRNLPSWVTDAVLTRTPRDVLRLFQNTIHKVSVRIVGRKWSVWCRPNIRRKLPAHLRSISLSLRTVLERYRPEPYPGRVTLVRARAQPIFRIRTFDLGWGTLASQVDVKVITGCHHHALVREPHVRRVARLLQTALDEAE